MFRALPSALAVGRGRFCSRYCADEALVVPLLQRLWRRIAASGPDDCWPWLGNRHPFGYGQITDRGRSLRAHRIVLEQKLGRQLSPGMLACHTCSYPPCCNPNHLYEGDHQANMDQRYAEGKYPTGSAAPMSSENRAARRRLHALLGLEEEDTGPW
jgi:hypothetical protein